MLPTRVLFFQYEVENLKNVLRSQEQNRACFWPDDWLLVPEPNWDQGGLSDTNLYAWFRNNCEHLWEVSHDSDGRKIFAFEDDGEATLFRLSF